jgi:hypothetical protein
MPITKVNSLGVSLTSPVTFPAGTVSLPSITTSGDTNTGTFFPAADTIAFTEGGAEAMRITSSGLVGIGTTNPTRPLDVEGVVIADTFCSLRYDGVPTSGTPLDVDISKIATSIADRSQSRTFEFTITEATGTANNLSRLFYVRLQEGTGFDISSAVYSFGSVSGTCTFTRPSALVWRISTSAGAMVVQGIFRKLSG